MKLRVFSYNLNGLRSAISKGFLEWIKSESPDILCMQEIKIHEAELDKLAFEFLGYRQFWNFAEKKGYSGVGILSKFQPDFISRGLGIKKFDDEGRILRIDLGDVTIVNSYIPSGTMGETRQLFKMEYLEAFMNYITDLKLTRQNIIICGDCNIAHKPIDINNPGKHKKSSGFLPEEREWLDRLISSGFSDTFRIYNSEPNQYSWWSYRSNARPKNLGWRLDYHMVTESLVPRISAGGIMQAVKHSDHCPVFVDININD